MLTLYHKLWYNTRVMILTYKLKHNKDYSTELGKAIEVANYALINRNSTSKHVKHIGLPSAISNQILRKYSKNKKIKKVSSCKLTIPNQATKIVANLVKVRCIDLELDFSYSKGFEKINQIEIGKEYAYISCTVKEDDKYEPLLSLGVDRNSTKHIVVCALSDGTLVRKMGKKAPHIRQKYKNIRSKFQKLKKYKVIKKIKQRESNIVRDLNHKIAKELVRIALANESDIKLEGLSSIRKTAKVRRKQKYTLNSWSFYQLQQFIEYKAIKSGVSVSYVKPQYTSKSCSKCGYIGQATNTQFKCDACSYATHRDCNASFNIANLKVGDCIEKRIYVKGALIPLEEQRILGATPEPHLL